MISINHWASINNMVLVKDKQRRALVDKGGGKNKYSLCSAVVKEVLNNNNNKNRTEKW